MNTADFLLRLGCALLCGAVIGAERQWRQRTAGLRTYTLVAVGSALFVTVGCLIPDPSSTRIASYAVSGVGFLGAGVIMRRTCQGRQEAQLRTLLVQLTSVSPLTLHELESVVGKTQTHAVLRAMLSSPERMDAQVEQPVSRLSLEKNVVGITWQLLPQTKTD